VVKTFLLLVFWTFVLPDPIAPVVFVAVTWAMDKTINFGISLILTAVIQLKSYKLLKFFPVRLVLADLIRCRVAPVHTTRISPVGGVCSTVVKTFLLLVFWTFVLPNPFDPVLLIFAFV